MPKRASAGTWRRDAWNSLRTLTAARIALGRAGGSQPTGAHLSFQLAHARARDAVHAMLDCAGLEAGVRALGLTPLVLSSAAVDRVTYLQRPDLGRRLAPDARRLLERRSASPGGKAAASRSAGSRFDLAVVIVDGLSATAVARNALPLLRAVTKTFEGSGLALAPVAIVTGGRVAIGDEIGALLGARLVAVLIGERPGLSAPDSLGVYLTFAPKVGRTDAERNCISNIREGGESHRDAAATLHHLCMEALKIGATGVGLKDERARPARRIGRSQQPFLIAGGKERVRDERGK